MQADLVGFPIEGVGELGHWQIYDFSMSVFLMVRVANVNPQSV
jgi:hypothetical protein